MGDQGIVCYHNQSCLPVLNANVTQLPISNRPHRSKSPGTLCVSQCVVVVVVGGDLKDLATQEDTYIYIKGYLDMLCFQIIFFILLLDLWHLLL